MAFHPFRSFRKHQKTLLAILTIFIMFIFVLSFGQGDFFQRMPYWVSSWFRKTEVAKTADNKDLTIHGKTVPLQELRELKQQRTLAIAALMHALAAKHKEIESEYAKLQGKFDPDSNLRRAALDAERIQLIDAQVRNLKYFDKGPDLAGYSGPDLHERLDIDYYLRTALNIGTRPGEIAQVLSQKQTTDSLLDFLIWKQQADKLGIQFTEADIDQELKRQTLLSTGLASLKSALGQEYAKLDLAQLYEAVGDEFRVRLAQTALMGYEPSLPDESWLRSFLDPQLRSRPLDPRQMPALFTPYDFWQFYKDQRSTAKVALLALPVEPFLDQVPKEPLPPEELENELKNLYDLYAKVEAAPDRSEPGFLEPRRMQIEWLGGRADSAYYRRAADLTLAASAVAAGAQMATGAVPIGSPQALNHLLVRDSSRLYRQNDYQLAAWPEHVSALSYYAWDMNKPESAAALVGQLMGEASGPAVLATYQASAVARLQKDVGPLVQPAAQKEKNLQFAMDGGFVTAFGTSSLLTFDPVSPVVLAASYGSQRPYLPLPIIEKKALEKLQKKVATNLLRDNLRKVYEALSGLNGLASEDRAMAAEEIVLNAIHDYHLTLHGGTTGLRSRHELGDDPGMKVLKDYYVREVGSRDPKAKNFPEIFFSGPPAAFQPEPWPGPQAIEPEPDSEFQRTRIDEPMLYWRTEDKGALVLPFPQVRQDVERAWRLKKARALAREKAKEIAAQVKKLDGDISKVRDLVEELNKDREPNQKIKLIEPDDLGLMARMMMEEKQGRFGVPHRYVPYAFKEELVPYPRDNFVNELLKLDKGGTTVLRDRPEKTLYVAVMTERNEPTPGEPSFLAFYEAYKEGARGGAGFSDPLLDRFIRERRHQYREDFIKQLRIEAGAANEQGEYRLNNDTREVVEGRGDKGL